MDRERLEHDALESAMQDLDEMLGDVDSPILRQLLLMAWVRGAHWGLISGVREGKLTADAVIREMRRRLEKG